MAIKSFKNKGTEDINYGWVSKEALRILPKGLHRKAQIKIARLGAVTSMQDLRDIRGNRFEALKGLFPFASSKPHFMLTIGRHKHIFIT